MASCLAADIDSNKFEDFERLIMGNKAYFLFTVEKLLSSTIKQLIQIANEDQCQKSLGIPTAKSYYEAEQF
jgi:histone deacetylase complex regulatory component SIN3